ncbi:MAG: rhomboid family intrarane serine protease [Flavipsychrobacter sp.]|jgi:membrane associated rhomboid family serine protease|nr:rhomboid family intrarane serine protease [Flavipsychrobacter sp.]
MFQTDNGRFQSIPTVVKNLVIINVLVFLLQNVMSMRGVDFDGMFALHFWRSPEFRWWQMITHMFMHGSMTHIFFNMFALWMFGRILENVWGPKRFLTFYLVCGLGAALCHLGVLTYQHMPFLQALQQYQQHPNVQDFVAIANQYPIRYNADYANQLVNAWRNDPTSMQYAGQSIEILKSHLNEETVGASGAVFGLLFAFGYLFPNTELMLLIPPMPIKAKWFVGIYAVFELFLGIQNSAGDNIAHFAHIGGMLFAFILLRIWKNSYKDRFY